MTDQNVRNSTYFFGKNGGRLSENGSCGGIFWTPLIIKIICPKLFGKHYTFRVKENPKPNAASFVFFFRFSSKKNTNHVTSNRSSNYPISKCSYINFEISHAPCQVYQIRFVLTSTFTRTRTNSAQAQTIFFNMAIIKQNSFFLSLGLNQFPGKKTKDDRLRSRYRHALVAILRLRKSRTDEGVGRGRG